MIKDITFGQFFPGKSVIHRMDPRVKLLLTVCFIVFIFVAGNPLSLAFAALTVVCIMAVTQVPVRLYLKNIKAILIVIILTSVLNALYINTGTVLVSFWVIKITTDGVMRAVFMSSRIIILIIISAILTYTTTPTELTDAIERLLKPLSLIGLGEAVHTMAMMMTIALRFIPTLIEETDKIMSAQKARGADLESGSLLERVKALIPILVPLLISSVRRAYELAEAMECRCYNGGKGRKHMKQLKMQTADYAAVAISMTCFATIIVMNIVF